MNSLTEKLIGPGSPFELIVANSNDSTYRIYRHAPSTLTDIFLRAWHSANKPFLIRNPYRITYGAVLSEAMRVSKILSSEMGIRPHSRVALLLRNNIDWPIYFIATVFSGATVVLMDYSMPLGEIAETMALSNCQYLITDKDRERSLGALAWDRSIPVIGDLVQAEVLPLSDQSQAENFKSYRPIGGSVSSDDLAVIAFTSGSTGKAKGVELTHRSLITGLLNMMLGGALMASRGSNKQKSFGQRTPALPPCALLVSPFSHIGGYSQLLLSFWISGKIVLPENLNTDCLLENVHAEKVRSITGADPSLLRQIVRADRGGMDINSLSSVYIHGAALQQNLIEELRQTFPAISIGTGYGMTETNGSIAVISGSDLLGHPTSVGPVLPSVQWRCLDSDGSHVPNGEIGEIGVRGAMLMRGYCGDAGRTSKVLQGGWYKTNDLGYMDEEGFLYIVDRVGNSLSDATERISSAQIERMLLERRFVDDVAVINVGGADRTTKWIVVFVPRSMSIDDKASLEAELTALTARFGDTFELIIRDTLPRTSSGKVDRHKISTEETV